MSKLNPHFAQLYKQLVQEAERFPQYNYRMYALRKIRDEFAVRQDIAESQVPIVLEQGRKELERLRRMTTVATLYSKDHLVIENNSSTSEKRDNK